MSTFRSESEFQAAVCELAKDLGCLVFHPPSKVTRTAIKGFPDLTICGREAPEGAPPNVLFRELKTDDGRVSVEQQDWIDRLTAAKADAAVWRPTDWPERVTAELKAIA